MLRSVAFNLAYLEWGAVKDREIEILVRRLPLYGQLGRTAEGLIKAIQRELKPRYGARSRSFRNRTHAH
jgi:hypothetical protein